jgi:chromosome segregation ATPase
MMFGLESSARVDALRARIEALAAELAGNAAIEAERARTQAAMVAAMEERIASLRTEAAQAAKKAESLSRRLTAAEERLAGIEEEASSAGAEMARIGNIHDEAERSAHANAETIVALRATLVRFEQQMRLQAEQLTTTGQALFERIEQGRIAGSGEESTVGSGADSRTIVSKNDQRGADMST